MKEFKRHYKIPYNIFLPHAGMGPGQHEPGAPNRVPGGVQGVDACPGLAPRLCGGWHRLEGIQGVEYGHWATGQKCSGKLYYLWRIYY